VGVGLLSFVTGPSCTLVTKPVNPLQEIGSAAILLVPKERLWLNFVDHSAAGVVMSKTAMRDISSADFWESV
jgi:hypothetical protein